MTRVIEVGVIYELGSGFKEIGSSEVNDLISQGARVTNVAPCGSICKKTMNSPHEGEVHLVFTGFSTKITLENCSE